MVHSGPIGSNLQHVQSRTGRSRLLIVSQHSRNSSDPQSMPPQSLVIQTPRQCMFHSAGSSSGWASLALPVASSLGGPPLAVSPSSSFGPHGATLGRRFYVRILSSSKWSRASSVWVNGAAPSSSVLRMWAAEGDHTKKWHMGLFHFSQRQGGSLDAVGAVLGFLETADFLLGHCGHWISWLLEYRIVFNES